MLTATNLFDYFEEASAEGEQTRWAARSPLRPQAGCDLKLMPRAPGWQDDPEATSALERIAAEPWVASVTRNPSSVDVLLDDDWIETVGQALLDGDGREETLHDLGLDQRFAVQFWDANATKALHAGHLRNLALGNSIAAALEQAGAEVERRSLISDIGRAMGEAMAGVLESGQHVHLWPSGSEKSDHFVGECYAGYVASGNAAAAGSEQEDSLTRELTMRGDAADTLIARVLAGDREALELWSKTRAWAIGGQRKTLARLGISFDRVFFESDYLPEMRELTEQGMREGRFVRRDDGVIFYPTGHEDFDELPLVRGDGVPTQHMRALAYWLAAPDMQTLHTMQVCGIEWVAHVTYRRQLMDQLMAVTRYQDAEEQEMHPTQDIFHGMVARQKRALSSSREGALLIDQLIDALDAQMEADPQGRQVRRAHPHPERTAPQVALGYFLTKPVTPEVEFDPEGLLTERGSPGWNLVRARARVSAGRPTDLRPAEQPDFRFAVVQSEIYKRHLRIAVQRLDVGPLARHIDHLARWALERDRSEHAARATATLLDRGARGLGLERR
jgi:arginyl-tRNA synthetase